MRGGVGYGGGQVGWVLGLARGDGVDAARPREARGAYLFLAVPGRTMRGETMRDPAPRSTMPPQNSKKAAPDYVAKIPREKTAWNKLTR